MGRITKDLLLVGSIPLPGVEEVFTKCSEYVGNFVPGLPDGEVGDRVWWVNYLAYRYYDGHPEIETTNRPAPVGGVPTWKPASIGDLWLFRVKPGVKAIHFNEIGYARPAAESYRIFTKLREEEVIPHDVRFQVCLPLTNSAMGWFFQNPDDWAIVAPAFEEAMNREIRAIVSTIPPSDLIIQWDACWEVLDMENYFSYSPAGGRLARNVDPAARLGLHTIPDDTLVGYHLCYGTLGGWPMAKPKDFNVTVDLANALVAKTARRVDYLHLPAARKAFDDAYYAPLERLKVADAKVYLGLIHDSERTLNDFHKRFSAAKQHLPTFGLASVCGYGRYAPEELDHALDVHRRALRELNRLR